MLTVTLVASADNEKAIIRCDMKKKTYLAIPCKAVGRERLTKQQSLSVILLCADIAFAIDTSIVLTSEVSIRCPR